MASILISGGINLALGLAANFLFRPSQPDVVQEGPRLSDLTLSTSAYGEPLPIHFGSTRTSGNFIWAPDIEEVPDTTETEAGGKGGGGGGSVSTTTYTYFASFAVGLGEGVAKDVLKIWANGKLIFDKTDSSLTTGKYEFRFYPGNETQTADPLIEATEGAGQVEANRGTCYIVCERWPLADFGNSRPNITALVAYEATDTAPFQGLTELSGFATPDEVNNFLQLDPFSDDLYVHGTTGSVNSARVSINGMAMQAGRPGSLGGGSSVYGVNGRFYNQRSSGANWTTLFEVDPASMQNTGGGYGGDGPTCTFSLDGCMPNGSVLGTVVVGDEAAGLEREFVVVATNSIITGNGNVKVLQRLSGGFHTQVLVDETVVGGVPAVVQDPFKKNRCWVVRNDVNQAILYKVSIPANFAASGLVTGPVTLDQVATYLKDGTQLNGTADAVGHCLLPEENALIISNGSSMVKVDLDDYSVLANNTTLGFTGHNQWATEGIFAFPRNGNSAQVVTIDTDDLTEVASQNVSLTGLPGLFAFGASAYDPRSHSIVYARDGELGANKVVRVFLDRRDADGVALSSVVTSILNRLGVPNSDIDVTALTGDTVRGYSIARPMTGRAALEPLQAGFFFDMFESDFTLKATKRGGASVVTIPSDDIGAASTDGDAREREVRTQETELPKDLVVRYTDVDTDYQQNAQPAQRVSNPAPTQQAVSPSELDLPIVFNATEAKQTAEKALYTTWAERVSVESELPWKYLALDPGDVFEATIGNDVRRLRMEQVDTGADLTLRFKSVQEDARSSQSTLAGDSGDGFARQPVPSLLPTIFLPLDLPLLSAADASFQEFVRAYYAYAAFDDGWPGAVLFQSRDDGATFNEISAATLEATYGTLRVATSAAATTNTWDESSTITLTVQRGISRFTSSTDTEVLNGANALVVLGPTGPEVLQFVNVTQTDASTVVLSRLLRGRLGTEPNAVVHAVGTRFVLLESGRVQRFRLPLDLRNQLLQYRAPTTGTALDDAGPVFHAYTGQDLLPYSVAQLRATRPGDDFQVTWVRRTRFNGELADGTDEVPLNEAVEAYDVQVLLGDVEVQSVTDQSATTYDLTLATFTTTLGFVQGQFPLLSPSFETTAGWVFTSNSPFYTGVQGSVLPQSGSRFVSLAGDLIAGGEEAMHQSVTLEDVGYNTFDLDNLTTRPTFTLRFYENSGNADNDTVQVIVEFRRDDESVISSIDTGSRIPAQNSWVQVSQSADMPVGTRKVRIRVLHDPQGALGVSEVYLDNFQCSLGTDMPPFTVRAWQKSSIVGRGRLNEKVL